MDRLASYLYYHRFKPKVFEKRYHTTLDKETCNKYIKEFYKGNDKEGLPVHMDEDIIDAWYPKTFAERVDKILLYLNSRSQHIGQQITLSYQESLSAFFVDREELVEVPVGWKLTFRKSNDYKHDLKYMLDYLAKCSYIQYTDGKSEEEWV